MPGRGADVVAVTGLAALVTLAIAAPVLRAPSERVFGMESVGRHHDPFTVMAQLEQPIALNLYSQPVTDLSGAVLARLVGGVAAYNVLVLISFPLAAAATYLLARHLGVAPAGAAVAAMAYAFSPFHLAHAAYHPHIAQTQWIPIYLLALWRGLDHASPAAVALLAAATFAVTLSNFYGGLIAAAITPVAVAAYVAVKWRDGQRSLRPLVVTTASLAVIAATGIAYAYVAAGPVVADRAAFAFPRADLFRYSALSWSYLMPPLQHPLLGATARRIWTGEGVGVGLLEQQVSVGWAVIALGLVASYRWLVLWRRGQTAGAVAAVPLLIAVGAVAFVCSLPPDGTMGAFTIARPSAWLYEVVPMFRAYARFGVVVQLMAALLAGIGVEYLRRTGTWRARATAVALLAIAIGEYAVAPAAMWRDVLPTTVHRWVMQQNAPMRVVDCAPPGQESASLQWLSSGRVTALGTNEGCDDPGVAEVLAAKGYTHLLVRRDLTGATASPEHPALRGLPRTKQLPDGEVLALPASASPITRVAAAGFFAVEHDGAWAWRWMEAQAAWTIRNAGPQPIAAALDIELAAFDHARHMDVRLDGRPLQTLIVAPLRRTYRIGPFTATPGAHELAFHTLDPLTVAGDVMGNGDPRRLSFAVGGWQWRVPGDER